MNKLSNAEYEFIISRIVENITGHEKNDNSDFEMGKRLAYYEILDIIKNELTVRNADLSEYGLDFDLDKWI